jgi:DNA polymerase III alpha subunit
MIHLRVRTEFSFRAAFGPIDKILEVTEGPIGICDRFGSWGHVAWDAKCKAAGRKPIFGVELAVCDDMKLRTKQGTNFMSFLAKNNKGLRELYELVSLSTKAENHYYTPRIDYSTLFDLSDDLIILSGAHPVWGSLPRRKNLFIELNPTSAAKAQEFAKAKGYRTVATADNFYPRAQDRSVYEALAGRDKQLRTSPMHLLSEAELRLIWPDLDDALRTSQELAEECNATLPRASMVHASEGMPSLLELCEQAAPGRGIDLNNAVYRARLERELGLIHEKQFEDYFYLVWDLVRYAKTKMLVGPARGSSCGSLVCYLLSITEIDPIPYALLFERFIDVNRKDLPDIDIDFPDDRRELVFTYLKEKYGSENVARLGTIMRYKARSAIDTIAKELNVPAWEVTNVKNSIIERSSGDSRAGFCIFDTFKDLEVGRKLIEKYPQMLVAAEIEGHASGCGQHAAGICVTADPISNYCSVDNIKGSAMIDKIDAETLNLLKIDALGLRTLSVLQDCIDQVGWSREQLIAYPTGDKAAYAILNDKKFAGIFQFEGSALQAICNQLVMEDFEDIASLTALARPGPLHSGGTTEFIKRRTGESAVVPLHPLIAHVTEKTYGVVIYQEDVMLIAREMGRLSWEDVSSLRKAMSKSYGKEYFDQYWLRFRVGANDQGIEEDDALRVWNQINTMGSWCLSGETLIQNPFPNHATPKFITIRELAENDGYVRKHAAYMSGPGKGRGVRSDRKEQRDDIIKKQQIYSMQPDGTIRPDRCIAAFASGTKTTFLLETECGKEIRATGNHKFWTGEWVPLEQLAPGQRIAIMGATEPTARKRKTGTGSGAHNSRHNGDYAKAVVVLRSRFTQCQKCYSAPYQETHHIDEDRTNNQINNLLPLCRSCYRKIHGTSVPHTKGKQILWTTIKSIGQPMVEDVYDLTMPQENFIANGFIVHNCFNRSHAVAYGMVSYWCLVLKAHFPLEFSAACLRNARDESQSIHLLRELAKEGYEFRPYDPMLSQKNWSVQDGKLIGGLLNIKGVGDKMADDIILRRSRGLELTQGQANKLANGATPYDQIFECEEKWGHLKKNPEQYAIKSKLKDIDQIQCEDEQVECCFIAKIVEKDLRDLNDPTHVKKRNGSVIRGNSLMVLLTAEDDTDKIPCVVDRHNYFKLGLPLIEDGRMGDWYIFKGHVKTGFRQVVLANWRKLSGEGANLTYAKRTE